MFRRASSEVGAAFHASRTQVAVAAAVAADEEDSDGGDDQSCGGRRRSASDQGLRPRTSSSLDAADEPDSSAAVAPSRPANNVRRRLAMGGSRIRGHNASKSDSNVRYSAGEESTTSDARPTTPAARGADTPAVDGGASAAVGVYRCFGGYDDAAPAHGDNVQLVPLTEHASGSSDDVRDVVGPTGQLTSTPHGHVAKKDSGFASDDEHATDMTSYERCTVAFREPVLCSQRLPEYA